MRAEPAAAYLPFEEKPSVLTVSQLSLRIKNHLEPEFQDVWVGGEVGKVTDHPSGVYFSLKDENAVLEAVIWRREAKRVLRFDLQTGTQVVAHGKLDLYEKRGQYKILVDRIEPQGVGALQKRFEQLKKKLAEEGLFDEARKRPIPFFPGRIGVVTALEGAAIRDILNTIFDRFPRASVVVRPSLVQGERAAAEIARAISDLNELGGVDVLIVGRGGGSLEDLWAFNEEVVARAIVASRIPVISAVGHEVDFTISDFVADLRATTPTDAAVKVVPRLDEIEERLEDAVGRLRRNVAGQLDALRSQLKGLREHWVLRRPVDRLQNLRSQLEADLEGLERALQSLLQSHKDRAASLGERLSRLRPDARLARQKGRLLELFGRLDSSVQRRFARSREAFVRLSEKLEGRSPVAILSRGYSLTMVEGKPGYLADTSRASVGDRLRTTLHRGSLVSRVEKVEPGL